MKFILLTFTSFFVISCGGSSDSTTGESTTDKISNQFLLDAINNGYRKSSSKSYDPAGVLLSTTTYTLNSVTNVITQTSTRDGDVFYHYYNSSGYFIKRVKIDELDINSFPNYSSNSYERYYTYDSAGLLVSRTSDTSIDGSINTRQTWTYDSNGLTLKREFDSDNDGHIDNTYDYAWSGTSLISKTSTEADGSQDITTYEIGTNYLPTSSSKDLGKDGIVDGTRIYSTNSNANLIRTDIFDASGNLSSYSIHTYISTGNETIRNRTNRDFFFF